ncbi:hypothetical protein G6Z16_02905, partial [Clostridium perfringens]|uniref:MucBP domain-containing protein n=2 Tax=Clostridium perfringens TaxID=1502 RepID=UPI0013E370C3
MNKKKLKVLVASALLSCCISSFIATPYNVEAKELKTSINQSINNQKQELKGKLHHEIQDSLIKEKNNSSKTQVKYQIKYIDDTTGKELDTITKIDFANETVTETARDFKGYRLVSEKNQSKTLIKNNDTIIFHYIKSPKTQVKYQIKYIDDTTGKELDTITKIDFANETVTETARDFEGYRLVSEKNQNKTLSEDNNDPIIFHYAKTQVKYQIKYIDDATGKELYNTITKIDFANETVTETARDFEGYRLVSEKNQSKTLSKDNDPIIFHYIKDNSLKELKEKKIKEIKEFKNKDYMDESKIKEAIDDINHATSADQINQIFNEIQKDNKVKYIPTKLRVRYVNAETGKDLISPITTIEWFGSLIENIKPEKIEGFTPVKKSEEILLKSKDINEVVFQYVKPNDNISLKDFMKKKVNLKVPIAYENIDFTNNYKGLKEFAIKQIYQRALYTKVITTKSDIEKLQYELMDMPIESGYVRYCRNVEYTQGKQIDKDRYEFTISFTYNLSIFNANKKDVERSEEIIDEFVRQNINDSMSDYDKAKKIYDYIIKIGSPSVKKNGETIRFTENNRTAYSAATLLIDGKGVCEAYAVAFSRLAERSGLETKFVSSIYTPLLAYQNYR